MRYYALQKVLKQKISFYSNSAQNNFILDIDLTA